MPAGLTEGQSVELVEDDEVTADELLCSVALASGTKLDLELVDQVDDVVAPAPDCHSDAGSCVGDREIGLA